MSDEKQYCDDCQIANDESFTNHLVVKLCPRHASVERLVSKQTVETLTNACQVFDGWHNDGTSWSAFDESVRGELSELLAFIVRNQVDEGENVSP